jgi:hypothetical protein
LLTLTVDSDGNPCANPTDENTAKTRASMSFIPTV